MEEKKIVMLDLTGCKYGLDLHERIRAAFDFQECYGQNWDAFWDFLRSECDADKVIIRGMNTMPESLRNYAKPMTRLLNEYKDYCVRYEQYLELEIQDS